MNKYFNLLVTIVICFLCTQGTSQIAFNSLYDFNNRPNYGLRAIEIESGYFISAGASGSNGGETFRYLHIDTVGYVINKKEYEILYRYVREGNLIKSYDNNFVDVRTVGHSLQSGGFLSWLTIQKVKQNGDTLWRKEFNFTQIGLNLSAGAVSEQADSGLFIACQGYRTGNDRELVFISTDKNGNEQWRKIIDTPGKSFVWKVISHPLGGYVISGGDDEIGQVKPTLIHINDTGKVLWKKRYTQGHYVSPDPFIQKDSSIVINADKYIGPDGRFDEFTKKQLFKTDMEGNIIWEKVHDDHVLANSYYTKCIQGLDGLIYCLGRIDYHNGTTATLSQINQDGDLLAVHRYTYNGDTLNINYIWDFIQTSDSGFLFVGDYNVTGQDVWVFKTKKNGCIDEECSTLIYGAFLGTEEKSLASINFNIYPNPAHDRVTIVLSRTRKATVALLNLSGQIIKKQQIGVNSNRIDISNLLAGVYIVQVTGADGSSSLKKLIIEH